MQHLVVGATLIGKYPQPTQFPPDPPAGLVRPDPGPLPEVLEDFIIDWLQYGASANHHRRNTRRGQLERLERVDKVLDPRQGQRTHDP